MKKIDNSLRWRRIQRRKYVRGAAMLLAALLSLLSSAFAQATRGQQTPARRVAPEAATAGAPSPAPTSTPELGPSDTEFSWLTYVSREQPLIGLFALILGVVVLAVFPVYVVPKLIWRLRRERRMAVHRPSINSRQISAATSRKAGEAADLYASLGSSTRTPPTRIVSDVTASDRISHYVDITPEPLKPADIHASRPRPGDVFYRPSEKKRDTKETRAGSSKGAASDTSTISKVLGTLGSPAATKGAALVDMSSPTLPQRDLESLRQDLDKVKKDILSLTILLGSQRYEDSPAGRSLHALAEIEMRERETAERVMVLEEKLQRVVYELERVVREQLKSVNDQQRVRNEEIGRLRADNVQLTAAFAELRDDFENPSHRNGQTAESDSFYAKTLGAILGQNVEALRAGEFDQMAQQLGERLNQFFQLEVPHGSTLMSLRFRAEQINADLKRVVAEMTRLKPETATGVALHLQRADLLAAELASLQGQLQDRRSSIETTLRIPVSLHAGARQTFLNELGRGVRREIDKLSDPQSHFVRELNRLITNDIASVVDVCDTIIAHPGTHPELEAVLGTLLTHAGLRNILPRQGDPFKAAEHEMVRAIASGPGKSMSIAQVTRRGFYHVQSDSETLLRRAAVAVYR
jgi:hypothetical protein